MAYSPYQSQLNSDKSWRLACKTLEQMKMFKNSPLSGEQVETHQWIRAAQIDQLEDLQSLIVETRNNTYEITILSGQRGDILLRGGSFRNRTPAHLSGASLAGSLLKPRGIYVGLSMELVYDGHYILTSPVRRIGIEGVENRSDKRDLAG